MALVTDESSGEYRLLCRSYYRGDQDAIYQDFLDMWISTGSEKPITKQQFCFENEIAKSITRRTNALPVDFTIEAPKDKPELKKTWEEYFEGSNFNHKPLVQVLNDIYLDMEIGGASIMVGYYNPENPKVPYWLKQTNMEYYPITDENDIFAISGYRFVIYREKIDEEGNKTDVTVTTIVTAEKQILSVEGEEPVETEFNVKDSKGDPVLAVVVFGREDLDGVYYRPGVSAMLNGQRNLNQGLTKRNEATKYDSFGVWCPDGEDYAGFKLGSDSSGNNKGWNCRPGSYVGFPVKKVGGSTSIGSIEKEIEEARDDISAAGQFVTSEEATGSTNGESGRSKLIGSKGMRDYVARLLLKVEDSLNLMLEISGYISGIKTEGVSFKSPEVNKEDPATIAAKADRMWLRGFKEEALAIDGYGPDKIKTLMEQYNAAIKEDDKNSLDLARNESLQVG